MAKLGRALAWFGSNLLEFGKIPSDVGRGLAPGAAFDDLLGNCWAIGSRHVRLG